MQTHDDKRKNGSNGSMVLTSPGQDRVRVAEGWRRGKPEEDPAKTKRWGFIYAKPSEFLVCMRAGKVVASGQGASCFKWPWDSVAVVPTTVQRLQFSADQVTSEKVGVEVTGLAVYRIAEPLIAFRMLNFSFPERAQEKLEELLAEMFVGATRRLVANLSVEQVLTRRKDGLAQELMREIGPVVSGSGRVEDRTAKGWGVVIDTIEVQDVRVQSSSVFAHMQARYRNEQERVAREAELLKERAVQEGETANQRQVELARVAVQTEVRQKKLAADEQAQREHLAAEARVAEAKLANERSLAEAKLRAEMERIRLEAEVCAARHQTELEARAHETELTRSIIEGAQAKRALAEVELATVELETRKSELAHALEVGRSRALREIENSISPEAIQLVVAQRLPELAAAFQQKMGEVHVTAVDGANPFGYVAAAVEGVLGLARSAGLALPTSPDITRK